MPWVRAALLAVTLGMCGAVFAIVTVERDHRVRGVLEIRVERDVEATATAHMGALLGPRTLLAAEDNEPGAQTFVETQLAVRTELAPGLARFHLETVGREPDRARRYVDALGTTYMQLQAATSRPVSQAPRVVTGLRERQAALRTRADAIRAEIERLRPLSAGKVFAERERLTRKLGLVQERWQEATARHEASVATLDELIAQPTPSGTVDAARRAEAERADMTLQQDEKALRGKIDTVHRELARAAEAVKPAAAAVFAALEKLDARLTEQRAAQPDLEVAAVLERLSLLVTDTRSMIRTFLSAWDAETSALPDSVRIAEVANLLARQSRLEGIVRDLRFEAEPLSGSFTAQLDALADEGEERTRRIVIQNDLHGPVEGVQAVMKRLTDAAAAAITSDNFKLDAACRSAAGLNRRLEQRRSILNDALQAEADRVATLRHQAQIDNTRNLVTERAAERDRALSVLTSTIRQILELDPAFSAVTENQAQLRAVRREAAALDAELARLDEVVALPWPGGAAPETLRYVPAVIEPLPHPPGRLGRGLATFVGTVLITFAGAVILTVARPANPDPRTASSA